MQLKEFNILLDMRKHNKIDYIEVVQGDVESNVLNIQLISDSMKYDLTGTTIEIAFSKSDGTTVIQDQLNGISIINAIEGKIQCTLNTNTIASKGKVFAEVRVFEGSKLLTSSRFEFFVRESIVDDNTIESTNEFPILNQLISTTEGLIQTVGQIEAQVPAQVVADLNAVSLLANQLNTELDAHKAEMATRLGRIEFNCIPSAGYKITKSKSYVINNVAYLGLELKKADDTAFAAGLNSNVVSVPHVLTYGIVSLNSLGLTSTGSPRDTKKTSLQNWNKMISLEMVDSDSTLVLINGVYLIN